MFWKHIKRLLSILVISNSDDIVIVLLGKDKSEVDRVSVINSSITGKDKSEGS
jgi:hypothetical protein